MGKFIALLVVLGAVVFGLTWAFDPSYQQMRADSVYYQQQQQQLELDQQQLAFSRQERLQSFDDGMIQANHLLLFLACSVALIVCFDFYHNRRAPLVRPDKRGMLPVARHQLENGELAELVAHAVVAYQHTQALRAVHQPQPTPHVVTYSPTVKTDGRAAEKVIEQSADETAELVNSAPPAFSELLANGTVGAGRPLLLGYANGEPVTGSFKDIYSSAVGGLPSTGKTTTIRFLASQAALLGARFVVVDHHAEKADGLGNTLAPLAPAFLCKPATDNNTTLQALGLVKQMFDARKAGDKDRSIVLLCIDEFSALMRSPIGGTVAEVVEELNQEGRGFGMFGLYSGQIWLASRSGGSELRYSLASSFVHRMHRNMARLLLPEGEGAQVERLPAGSARLWRPSGEVVTVRIPNTTSFDVQQVAGLLGKPDGSQMVAKMNQATTASGSDKTASADAARAASMFLAGKEPADIVFELRRIKSNEGRRYQSALVEVLELIRQGIEGGQR